MGAFQLPPYPHDKIGYIKTLAADNNRQLIDLSIGTPCDPPSHDVQESLAQATAANGYPPSIGSAELRLAARQMLARRFGVNLDEEELAMCVGTKEFVATLPLFLSLRHPGKDTLLYPAVSYPTYAMGAEIAGMRAVPVPCDDNFMMNLESLDKDDLDRALLLWVNSPANPTGVLENLEKLTSFAESHSFILCSDECYAEFSDPQSRDSVLRYKKENVLAVHSLSKRSNAAGLRVGFYAGDQNLVYFLKEIRKHAGMMIPGPIQAAGVVALGQDAEVEQQWDIYRERLSCLVDILDSIGISAELPSGAFYLWVKAPERYLEDPTFDRSDLGPGWRFAEDLARYGGMLVSPGDFYGPMGADYVRIAAVQPLGKLEIIKNQFIETGWSYR
jgi:aspartate/methionine/tyrosine aminotransferase